MITPRQSLGGCLKFGPKGWRQERPHMPLLGERAMAMKAGLGVPEPSP